MDRILPLLSHAKLLQVQDKKYKVKRYDWEAFCLNSQFKLRSYRKLGRQEEYFICNSTPQYKNPHLQEKSTFKFNSLRYFNSTDRLLRNQIESHVKLLPNPTPNITTTNNNNLNHEPPAPTQTLPNKIEEQINYALALDLQRRPRLS